MAEIAPNPQIQTLFDVVAKNNNLSGQSYLFIHDFEEFILNDTDKLGCHNSV